MSRRFIVLLFLAGCFSPAIPSGGFACHLPDHPQCPQGFTCMANLCVQDGTELDLSSPTVEDLAQPPSSGDQGPPQVDLAHTAQADLGGAVHDLAQPASDLAQPPAPDMAKPACVPTGGDCFYHRDSACCSNYCIYSTEKCK